MYNEIYTEMLRSQKPQGHALNMQVPQLSRAEDSDSGLTMYLGSAGYEGKSCSVCSAGPHVLQCPRNSTEPVTFLLPVHGKRPVEEFEF